MVARQRCSAWIDYTRVVTERGLTERQIVVRWVRTMLAVFLLLGLSFGTWLSRLPAVRDQLDASTLQMTVFGLCLATGSVVGLIISGQVVQRFGAKRTLLVTGLSQVVALPIALAIVLNGSIPFGLAVLFVYGFTFATADVAMNVSGAGAERALGRSRMPLMHAGYSTGAVAAMGLGALAESVGLAPELHFAIVFGVIGIALLVLQRGIPADAQRTRGTAPTGREAMDFGSTGSIPIVDSAAGQRPAFSTMTGSIPIISHHTVDPGSAPPTSPADPAKRYSPWRDKRVLIIGAIALAAGLLDGTASDWLPLALVDGRGVTNETGALMLAVFFAAILAVRLVGSALINRFGRVAILRTSAVFASVGVVTVIVAPGPVGLLLGTIVWGLGSGLGWPIAISASADRAETATRDVAAVSALGYGSMIVGPMAFGLLGEFVGLLNGFWALLLFTVLIGLIAGAAREGGSTPFQKGRLSR